MKMRVWLIWDPKDGRIVMATKHCPDANIDKPGTRIPELSATPPGTFAVKEPFSKVAWCCKANPDDTGILVAGGVSNHPPPKRGLTFIDLGPTPVYQTSTWATLSDHFKVKKQNLLPTPAGAEIVDFLSYSSKRLLTLVEPKDPIAILALLSSGELVTLSFPTGHPHLSHQPTTSFSLFRAPFRDVDGPYLHWIEGGWLGMTENRQQGPQLLRGGVEGLRSTRKYESRNIVQNSAW